MLFISFLSVSQIGVNTTKANTRDVDVSVVRISDKSFYEMLETLLEHERNCSYYTDSLPYGIYVGYVPTNRKDSVVVASISGYSDKEIFLNQDLLGCLSYKGHDFFIRGDDLINSMVITNQKKTFKYWENYPIAEDDSWAIYDFAYYNDEYHLYNKSNTSKCKCQ